MSATSFGRQASELSDRVKTVHDPVHGGIRVDGFFLEIMDRHEMQRLRGVKQLGMGNFVFPGANHTRFEHCLGTYYLAGRMAKADRPDKQCSYPDPMLPKVYRTKPPIIRKEFLVYRTHS